jgi:hypothetical protein
MVGITFYFNDLFVAYINLKYGWQQTEQLKSLKEHLDEEITFHQQRMKEHQDAIATHQKRITELEQKKKA